MNICGHNIDDFFRECLECTLDDCVGKANPQCPIHTLHLGRSRGGADVTEDKALQLPEVLSHAAMKTQDCRKCSALVDCAELVATGAPCLCERTGVIWVGRDELRVEV